MEDGPSTQVLSIQMGDPDGALGSCFSCLAQPGLSQVLGMNKQMGELAVSPLLCQIKCLKRRYPVSRGAGGGLAEPGRGGWRGAGPVQP